MDGFGGGGMPEGGPPLPPESAEVLFLQAEEARRHQVWETAIRHYRFALQKDPSRKDALHGLALSYEAKSLEPGYESYLSSAMEQYRKMIALDSACGMAHDGLLVAAAKMGLLNELMEEYRKRIASGGPVQAFREAFRKMQTLLLLQAAPVKKGGSPPPPIFSLLFGVVAPGVAILTLIGAILVRVKGGSAPTATLIAYGLAKISFFSFLSFLGYKVFLYWRVSS